MKNYYQILGIPNLSSMPEIRKAYRSLALEHHPDRGGKIEKMQELNSAYEHLLKNKESYDLILSPSKWKTGVRGFTVVVNGSDWVHVGDLFRY